MIKFFAIVSVVVGFAVLGSTAVLAANDRNLEPVAQVSEAKAEPVLLYIEMDPIVVAASPVVKAVKPASKARNVKKSPSRAKAPIVCRQYELAIGMVGEMATVCDRG